VTPPVFYAAVGGVEVGAELDLGGDEGRHAADVRRLLVNEQLDLTDGRGTVLHCVVTAVRRGALTVAVRDRTAHAAPELRLTVVQALAKGGRDEQAVEAMTEVGVDHVIGWEAARNVAHWTDRTQGKWLATSRAAAKQSRRSWWPEVTGPATTPDVARLCAAASVAVVLHESASSPLAGVAIPARGEVLVVVGPEGGITDAELAAFDDAGARLVRLGQSVLRSSTAGVAALSVISATTRWQ
jgi:16S rRNA (uracil1498-N3)-methyltransferase